MTKENTIGTNIRILRMELKLTQEELARKADIPYPTLMKIEQGKVVNPTLKTLEKLVKVFNISIDSLVNDEIKI